MIEIKAEERQSAGQAGVTAAGPWLGQPQREEGRDGDDERDVVDADADRAGGPQARRGRRAAHVQALGQNGSAHADDHRVDRMGVGACCTWVESTSVLGAPTPSSPLSIAPPFGLVVSERAASALPVFWRARTSASLKPDGA